MTARAPIQRGDMTLAWLVLGTRLQPMLDALFPPSSGLRVRLIESGGSGQTGVPIDAAAGSRLEFATDLPGRPVGLDVQVDDLLRPVRDQVVHRLLWALPLAALGLGFALGATLLWQLRPLRQISEAARRVGQGDLHPPLPEAALTELSVVTGAFKQMLHDLRRFEGERSLAAQRERLQAIGRMAARVAHDINNPLTVIQTHLSLLQRRGAGTDTDLGESLAKMSHHCERCRRTVEQLLHYGRPARLQCAPVDLRQLCADIASRARQQRPAWQVQIERSGQAAIVQADPMLLEQVIDNLLTNAWEACPDQPASLAVSVDAGGVSVWVRDHGPGFSEEARQHAFEPFYTSKRTGSGLGLASCQAIAQAHGGRLQIDAEDSGGCVHLWLPRTPATLPAPEVAVAPQITPNLANREGPAGAIRG